MKGEIANKIAKLVCYLSVISLVVMLILRFKDVSKFGFGNIKQIAGIANFFSIPCAFLLVSVVFLFLSSSDLEYRRKRISAKLEKVCYKQNKASRGISTRHEGLKIYNSADTEWKLKNDIFNNFKKSASKLSIPSSLLHMMEKLEKLEESLATTLQLCCKYFVRDIERREKECVISGIPGKEWLKEKDNPEEETNVANLEKKIGNLTEQIYQTIKEIKNEMHPLRKQSDNEDLIAQLEKCINFGRFKSITSTLQSFMQERKSTIKALERYTVHEQALITEKDMIAQEREDIHSPNVSTASTQSRSVYKSR